MNDENARYARAGFTMAELMMVILIIVILTTILIPVVSKVRRSAQATSVAQQISSLAGAIERYHQDFGAYPGPLSNDEIYSSTFTQPSWATTFTGGLPSSASTAAWDITLDKHRLTGSENLVLGLLGGLRVEQTTTIPPQYNLRYDPTLVGGGPLSLNPAGGKKWAPYLETVDLSWRIEGGRKTGRFKDDSATADDTIIPEILDRFPSRMPILYLRARVGLGGVIRACDANGNPLPTGAAAQNYDLKDMIAYTKQITPGVYIGEGRSLSAKDLKTWPLPPGVTRTGNESPHGLQTVTGPPYVTSNIASLDKQPPSPRKYYYPYDAYAYFESPTQPYSTAAGAQPAIPRNKDSFILISAGPDRVYGTEDDITSFGSLFP